MPDSFDVFLSHHHDDGAIVAEVAARLRRENLRPWLDAWELRPGLRWQEEIESAIAGSRAVAVFIGAHGLGPWQEPEMRAFLARSRREPIPVIPVLLPDCPRVPELVPFLEAFTAVDLRRGVTDAAVARLVWGITGRKSDGADAAGDPPFGMPSRRHPRAIATLLAVVAITAVIAFGILGWPRLRAHFASVSMYALRVQVLDPDGHPVEGAIVRTSVGNEPHRLPDGWWEIQIPAAKVATGGLASVWVEHKDWSGSKADIHLGNDPNPRLEVRLHEPHSWIRGRVVDTRDRALPDVRVSLQDGTGETALTDADGRFELKLAVPADRRIRLRAERRDLRPADEFCYSSRDGCAIIMER